MSSTRSTPAAARSDRLAAGDEAGAFRLRVEPGGLAALTFDAPDHRVNLLGIGALEELEAVVDQLGRRGDIEALVLLSGKRDHFASGPDVHEIEVVEHPPVGERLARMGQGIFAAWEALPFPTVAAIDGACLGGGLELALAASRIVVSDRRHCRLQLPQVTLGTIPWWGGCTRLPRRIGLAAALQVVVSARPVSSAEAVRLGLADRRLPAAGFLAHLRRYVDDLLAEGAEPGTPARRDARLAGSAWGHRRILDRARRRALEATGGNVPAPLRAVEVMAIGVTRGRAAGFEAEARAAGELATSGVCKNLVRLHLLQEEARNAAHCVPRRVRQVAVVGAGRIGGALAHAIVSRAGVPVRLVDEDPQALAAAFERAAATVSRGGSWAGGEGPGATDRRRLALLRPSCRLDGLSRCDLLIEAVPERLDRKRDVIAASGALLPAGAVVATTTPTLSIDGLAAAAGEPANVVGMHMFHPLERLPLVEVVAGTASSPEAIETVLSFARRLGKTPIVVRNGPGFLVNRLLAYSFAEALWLLHEGYPVPVVDGVVSAWGLPPGPFALMDRIGLDTAFELARVVSAAFPGRLPLPPWIELVLGDDRRGEGSRRGFYRYRRGARREDGALYELLGVDPRRDEPDPIRLVDRLVLRVVDEAARCLDEEIVAGPGLLDLALVLGAGFPPFRGGLCRWADHQGLGQLVIELERLEASVGERFAPSGALRAAAAAGGFYAGSA